MYGRGYLWQQSKGVFRLVEFDGSGYDDGRVVVHCVDNPSEIYVLDVQKRDYKLKISHPEINPGSVIQVCKSNAHYGGTLMIVDCIHDDYVIARIHAFNGRDYYQKIMHGDYHYIGESEVSFDD